MNITEINTRIKNEVCLETIDKLKDENIIKIKYINYLKLDLKIIHYVI